MNGHRLPRKKAGPKKKKNSHLNNAQHSLLLLPFFSHTNELLSVCVEIVMEGRGNLDHRSPGILLFGPAAELC